MPDTDQPITPVKTDKTSTVALRLPDSLIERAEEIAAGSAVFSKLDVIRASIEKGLPAVAEMFGVAPAAESKEEGKP